MEVAQVAGWWGGGWFVLNEDHDWVDCVGHGSELLTALVDEFRLQAVGQQAHILWLVRSNDVPDLSSQLGDAILERPRLDAVDGPILRQVFERAHLPVVGFLGHHVEVVGHVRESQCGLGRVHVRHVNLVLFVVEPAHADADPGQLIQRLGADCLPRTTNAMLEPDAFPLRPRVVHHRHAVGDDGNLQAHHIVQERHHVVEIPRRAVGALGLVEDGIAAAAENHRFQTQLRELMDVVDDLVGPQRVVLPSCHRAEGARVLADVGQHDVGHNGPGLSVPEPFERFRVVPELIAPARESVRQLNRRR